MRWFGHVERMEDRNPVKESRNIEVPGPRGRGRPRKTWAQLIKDDLRQLNSDPGLAKDREAWKRAT